jgi:glycosyltransferase involved in cell wall biosynthesis
METRFDIYYLGRSRLHRSRANLIHTLRTVAGFEREDWRVQLVLRHWPKNCDVSVQLRQVGIEQKMDIVPSRLLHPRWKFWPYVWWNRTRLEGQVIYTRVAEISLALARYGLEHHLEVHDVRGLSEKGQLSRILTLHRLGVLKWLFPISQSAAKELLNYGAVDDRIRVAPCGVDVEAYADIQPLDTARLDRPRIVNIGRLGPERGLAIFEALAEYGQCDITLIGAKQVSPKGNMSVVPYISPRDVPKWYDKCDIVLLPYQPTIPTVASMSPIKLFESMAAGRPIIASDLPTIREVVRHEETALLVSPSDPKAWLDALKRLQADRGLASRLAESAKKDAARYDYRYRARQIAETIGLAKR